MCVLEGDDEVGCSVATEAPTPDAGMPDHLLIVVAAVSVAAWAALFAYSAMR